MAIQDIEPIGIDPFPLPLPHTPQGDNRDEEVERENPPVPEDSGGNVDTYA